jgi:hypothetical protein
MKTHFSLIAIAALTFLSAPFLSAETPAPAPAAVPTPAGDPTMTAAAIAAALSGKNPLEQLKIIRDQNAKLIEQQKATLKTLEDLEKTSSQLKFFGKRS